jgi:hypothetical protein
MGIPCLKKISKFFTDTMEYVAPCNSDTEVLGFNLDYMEEVDGCKKPEELGGINNQM